MVHMQAVRQRRLMLLHLPSPVSAKRDHAVVPRSKIQLRAHEFMDDDALFALVCQNTTAGDHIT